MLFSALLALLFCNNILASYVENDLKYIPPIYSIQNPNFTAGSVFVLTLNNNETTLSSPDVLHSIGTYCSMKGYNEGEAQKIFNFNLRVNFNLDAYSINIASEFTGLNFMNLMETNLVYKSNGSSAGEKYLNHIGAMLGNSITMQFFNYVPFFAGFQIPSINYEFSTFSKVYDEPQPILSAIQKDSIYDISASTGSNFEIAGTQLLRDLNWSLVAPIFSRDDFGFYGQEYLQSNEYSNFNISVTCSKSIPDDINSPEAQRVLNKFVTCIANVDDLTTIWLWMNFFLAYEVIKWFRDRGHSKLNFIIYVDIDLFVLNFADPKILENVIFFRPFVGRSIGAVIDDCASTADDQNYIGRLTKFTNQCIKTGTGELPGCNLNNPQEVCKCTENLSKIYQSSLVKNTFVSFSSVNCFALAFLGIFRLRF